MKLLFLCTTEFQLLTALNMKYHMYPDDIADIIVDNYHGEEAALAERLVKTKLFRKVCYVNSHYEQKTLHAYLLGISDGKKTVSFGEALSNTLKFTESRIKNFLFAEKGYLSVLVNGFDALDIEEYDEFFAYGGKNVTKKISVYLRKKNNNCKVNQIDEGVASYCYNNVGEVSSLDACFLYEPKARIPAGKTLAIPKLSRSDREFIELVNYVFELDETQIDIGDNDVIFFDQGVEGGMPKYLRNITPIKKILFHNAYKRHLKEDQMYRERRQMTKNMLSVFKGKKIWIKPHPRSSEDAISSYDMFGNNIKVMSQYQVPWEVIALNIELKNVLLVTVTSSSVFLYSSVFDEIYNSKAIVLHKMFTHDVIEEFDAYTEKLQKMYGDEFVVPKDLDAFCDVIGEIKR